MLTSGQFQIPEDTDLSSASAMRLFAESVDERIGAARRRLYDATHPDCIIATLDSTTTINESEGWSLVLGVNTVFRTTRDSITGSFGFRFGNGSFPNGIYMAGGTIQYYTYNSPNGVDVAFEWRDDTDRKYEVTVPSTINTTTLPSARGEEFMNFMFPAECHIPVDTELRVYMRVHNPGAYITVQTAESRLWLWRLRGSEDA
jgi:hypothetical protein